MHILFITPRYPTKDNSYANPFFREQAEALSDKHIVTVVSAELNNSKFSLLPNFSVQKEIKNKLKIHLLSVCKSVPIYNSYNHAQVVVKYVVNLLKDNKFDIIHCQNSFIAGYIGYLLHKELNIPYVITQHSYFTIDNSLLLKGEFKPIFRSKIHEYLIRKAFTNASKVISVGPVLKNELDMVFNINSEVIPNVVDVNSFYSIEPKKKQGVKIGFVGNLLYNKGIDVLLEAMTLTQNDSFYLDIVGSGKFRSNLENIVKENKLEDRVTFRGYFTPDKLKEFYSEIDIFILPSRRETFGVVVIEALSAGLPVITNPCGGPEFIINDKVGLLYKYCDAYDLAIKIDQLIQNLSNYGRKSINDFANINYGKEVFNKRHIRLYNSILGCS